MTEKPKAMCPECERMVLVNKDGRLRKHPWCTPAVSDPAPTVEETTTQGDDVNDTDQAKLDDAFGELFGEDVQDQIDYERRVTHGEDKGPWFGAMYEGRCSVSECLISEGDRIRADGQGGYECEDCGDDDLSNIAPETVTYQQQASAAARRHVVGMDPVAKDVAVVQMPHADDAGLLTVPSTGPLKARHITADEFLFEDPTATEDVKPVMSVSGQPKEVLRDHMKRYCVVLPGETELELYKTSGKPVGRTRATTFNKAATDKKNINDWGKRNVVIGASRRRDLLLKAQGLTHELDRDRLNAIVVELEDAAGAKVGSDLGTYLHDFTEYMDAGLKTYHDAPEEFRESLRRYAQQLKHAGLEPITSLIERTTIIREFGWVCGTFDRIFYHRPSGQYLIGDLKTAKTMDYGKNEIECQLWTYAHGVNQNGIYDWNTRTWEEPHTLDNVNVRLEVSETVGVVIHMPVQGDLEGTVQLLWADLENGRQHAELCHRNRSQPKGKMKPWGDGPAPLARPTWEDRFRAVTSGGEASKLWREAKADAGVDAMRLQDLILSAQQRLRELGVKG